MTVGELIERIIMLRGRQYDEDIMVGWLNEIEGQVVDDVVNRAEGYDMVFKPLSYAQDTERQLTIPERFQDVYINYMLSKIDYHNQETERYNNDVVMYNSAYDAYAAWFRRAHRPKRGAMFSKF
ncbi:hypothetical protein ACG0Z4_21965 [Enterocloster aldenensis]|uniref:hypothetical protein n=1 Tax=Enterocloster aldenensis TaxID=358742 RepID=UPI0040297C3A